MKTLASTVASWIKEAGGELFTIKEFLGHKSIQMAERYSHIGESILRRSTEKVFGGHLAHPETPPTPMKVVGDT